jgi:hypothetical protein
MAAESNSPDEAAAREPMWLLRPEEVPAGIRLQLTSVLEASELTPEVLEALGHAVRGIQKASKTIPYSCPKLRECGSFKDPIGCPNLVKCTDYAVTSTQV